MYRANNRLEITGDMARACQEVALRLGLPLGRVRDYFVAGDKWEADSSEDLADLIAQCWTEQATESDV